MPGLSEILRSLYGAYRLARFDAGGLAFLDSTIGGFWRSFFAAVLVAPLYVIMLDGRLATGTIDGSPARFLAVEMIAYVIGWVAFPLVLTAVVRPIDRERHYLRYVVAYNWAAVWQNAVYLPLAILSLYGILPDGPATFFMLVVFVAVLVYLWFVARVGLDIPGPLAVSLVALDLGLSFLVEAVAERLL